ncbi:MAG: hypothetical protein P0116_08330 [Candidatus Nitrosocosmicus sp.]|nr:hypothetical protein [Candidatus Nitrosocosmicus sp.]
MYDKNGECPDALTHRIVVTNYIVIYPLYRDLGGVVLFQISIEYGVLYFHHEIKDSQSSSHALNGYKTTFVEC